MDCSGVKREKSNSQVTVHTVELTLPGVVGTILASKHIPFLIQIGNGTFPVKQATCNLYNNFIKQQGNLKYACLAI